MNYIEVASKRSVPGILVFDDRENLIFFNRVALGILAELNGNGHSPLKDAVDISVPKEIYNLYSNLKKVIGSRRSNPGSLLPGQLAQFSTQKSTYYGQGSLLQCSSTPAGETFQIMILIEKLMQRHDADLDTFKKRFNLTDRQIEIVKGLLIGWTNKKIADEFCICEDTVKGHLKRIMKRSGARSRTGIFSKVSQF